MSKFKTKARTIELLGRKQIRDSVTALAELMKNSYDADAMWVKAYFNSDNDNIILVDNGDGMSSADIEEKWLVLGTPSKSTKERVSLRGRPFMGAKGIGRLAAARLSHHYIMLTKTLNGNFNVTYLFWDLFEDTTISLEEVEIPTRFNIDSSTLSVNFSSIIHDLIETQINNIEKYSKTSFNPIKEEIIASEVRSIDNKAKEIIKYLGLISKKGTLLFMSGLRDDWETILVQDKKTLEDNLSAEKNYTRLANFVATLNSAYKKYENTDHDFVEIFKNEQIMMFHEDYNEDDYNIYDIKFEGVIKSGIFKGQLFAKNSNEDILVKANKVLASGIDVSAGIKNVAESDCGPIKLKICHIEGQRDYSSLSRETYDQIHEKIDILGGIGIYRDGVKVLPYGEPENDYLEIEKRRTIKAGVYVFSHRNIFGRIDISSKDNPLLEDKSSREGFIENTQYQYFISTLKNLLIKIAQDFLSDARKSSFNIRTYMVKYYDERKKREEEIKEFQKKEREKFKEIVKNLNNEIILSKNVLKEIEQMLSVLNDLQVKLQNLSDEDLFNQFTFIFNEIAHLEYKIKNSIEESRVLIPERFYFDLEKNEEKLFIEISKINLSIDNMQNNITKRFENIKNLQKVKEKEFIILLEQRKKVEEKVNFLNEKLAGIEDILKTFFINIEGKKKYLLLEAEKGLNCINKFIGNGFDDSVYSLEINKIRENISSISFENYTEIKYKKIIEEIELLSNKIHCEMDGFYANFEKDIETKMLVLKKISDLLDDSNKVNQDDNLIGKLKTENAILNEEVDLYEDLANFGMASEILNHEFNQFYTMANDAIIQLSLNSLDNVSRYWLKQISVAFNSIYERHSLLSPMYKIKSDIAKDCSLQEIVKGTVKIFSHKFNQEKINCQIDIPEEISVKILPSHFYPALSNIISNAIFWLMDENEKKIYIHYVDQEKALYIEDNGKGILAENKNDVFKPFYSLKPNGRGLGLAITKRVLQKDGHDIDIVEVSEYKYLTGACFKITFREN